MVLVFITKAIKNYKILIFSFAAALLMIFVPLVSWADEASSPSPDSDPEEVSITLSAEDLSFISDATSEQDYNIRLAAIQAAATTTYSVDDIYNLLISVYTTYTGRASWAVFDQTIYNQINNNFSHYDSSSGNTYDTGAMLWTIRNAIIDLHANLTPAMGDTIYDLVSNIDSMLSSFFQSFQNYDYTSALFYNSIGCAEYLSQIKSCLVDSNGLSIAQRVNALVQIDNNFANNMNLKVGSIDTKLSTTNSSLTSINNNLSDISNNTSNINVSVNSVNSSLQSFNNDFNNINWINTNSTYSVHNSLQNAFDNVVLSPNSVLNNIFIKFSIPDWYYEKNLFRISIAYGSDTQNPDNTIINNFYRVNSNDFNTTNIMDTTQSFIVNSDYFSDIYFFDYNIRNTGPHFYIIELKSNKGYYTHYDSNYVYYINSDNSDYYTIVNYLTNIKSINHYNLWKEIYASQDILEAKAAQQDVEDQALDDFTGSGSASASVSNIIDVKNVSSTLKSGLPNQGSLSNVLNIFNPNNSVWSWFSQDNYNDINNPSLQTRDYIIVDFITDNEYQYYNIMLEGVDR